MKFQNLDEIVKLIKNPKNEELLERAKQIKHKHQLHIAGIGLNHFIDKIQGIENANALSIRRALSKEATVPLYSSILKPLNKVFSARGGQWNYIFSNDTDKLAMLSLLNNIDGQYSMNDWMANRWKDKVNIDPFGLAFVEVNELGTLNTTYKSVEDIHDISYKSISDIDYVIFQPYQKEKAKYYRVVDEVKDYLIEEKQGKYSIVENETFVNYFKQVPGVIFSTKDDNKSDCKTTHIAESMISADSYLLDYTIYTIVKTKVGIPYVWEYERACPVCQGTGNDNLGNKCPQCDGTGVSKVRDVSDVIILPTPENGVPTMTPPAGYVIMPSEVVNQFESTLDREKNEIAEAIWGDGAVNETNQSAKTAFEINSRKESETSKLNEFSRNAELFETALTDLFGIFYFPSTYKGCTIVYGRRYKTDSIDALFAQYNEALTKKSNTAILNELIKEYWYALYENNEMQLQTQLRILETKPFYHSTALELVQYKIDKKDYLKNLYFDAFMVDFEKSKPLYIATIDEINTALENYITTNYSSLLVPVPSTDPLI